MKRVTSFISSLSNKFIQSDQVVMVDFGSSSMKFYLDGVFELSKPSFFSQFSGNKLEKFHLVDRGTIRDIDFAVQFFNDFLRKEVAKETVSSNFRGYYLMHSGTTNVEKTIIQKFLSETKYGRWKSVYKKDLVVSEKGLVIDFGFDLTEVMLGVGKSDMETKTIKMGSRIFTRTIRNVVRQKCQLEVSWAVAEKIKKEISEDNFLLSSKKSKQKITVRGKDIYSFVPKTIVLDVATLQEPLLDTVNDLFEEIKLFFSKVSTNLLMNSIEKGVVLTGEGAKLAGLQEYFQEKLQTSIIREELLYGKPE